VSPEVFTGWLVRLEVTNGGFVRLEVIIGGLVRLQVINKRIDIGSKSPQEGL
jgi:hypothetical protein